MSRHLKDIQLSTDDGLRIVEAVATGPLSDEKRLGIDFVVVGQSGCDSSIDVGEDRVLIGRIVVPTEAEIDVEVHPDDDERTMRTGWW